MTYTPGIDVSHWQARTPPLGGVFFLIARATYGTSPDDAYPMHIRNARSAGIVTGAYHFGRNVVAVDRQVAAFVKAAGDVDLYALDVERDGTDPAMSEAQARDFIARFHKATGKRIGLYMSESGFHRDVGQDWNWVANWDREPRIPFAIWQYGKSSLHVQTIDGDRFRGTLAGLRLFADGQLPDTSTGVEPMSIYLARAEPGVFVIPAGVRVNVYAPAPTGWEVVDTWPPHAEPSSARYDLRVTRLVGDDKPTSLIRASSGGFAGQYLPTAALVEDPDPTPADPTPYDDADVEAKIAADRAKARIVWG